MNKLPKLAKENIGPYWVITKVLGGLTKAEANEIIRWVEQYNPWIPVSERLPKKGKCLVLCEGKIHEVVIRVTEDEWEDAEGVSYLKDTAACDIRHLGCVLLGHDECITHWKPIILPEQAIKEAKHV